MGWDADEAERYRRISASLRQLAETIARQDADRALRSLLVGMSASYEKLARHFLAREATAHLRCEGEAQTAEELRASLAMRSLYSELQEQWATLSTELEKTDSLGQREA